MAGAVSPRTTSDVQSPRTDPFNPFLIDDTAQKTIDQFSKLDFENKLYHQNEKLQELQQRCERLESNNQQLTANFQRSNQELQQRCERLESANQQLTANLQGSNQELQQRCERLESANQQLTANLQGSNQELQQRCAQLEGSNQQLTANFQRTNQSLKHRCSDLERLMGAACSMFNFHSADIELLKSRLPK